MGKSTIYAADFYQENLVKENSSGKKIDVSKSAEATLTLAEC